MSASEIHPLARDPIQTAILLTLLAIGGYLAYQARASATPAPEPAPYIEPVTPPPARPVKPNRCPNNRPCPYDPDSTPVFYQYRSVCPICGDRHLVPVTRPAKAAER